MATSAVRGGGAGGGALYVSPAAFDFPELLPEAFDAGARRARRAGARASVRLLEDAATVDTSSSKSGTSGGSAAGAPLRRRDAVSSQLLSQCEALQLCLLCPDEKVVPSGTAATATTTPATSVPYDNSSFRMAMQRRKVEENLDEGCCVVSLSSLTH